MPRDLVDKIINEDLRRIRKTYDTVPTHKPKRSGEQVYYYLNTGVYRVYFYINNEWRYIGLT